MPVSQAYILPYCKAHGTQFEVLVGFKQVISFDAVAQQMHKPDIKTWQRINFIQPLDDNGNIMPIDLKSKIGKRFQGILLPAGGKPAFFGGRIERNETPANAAIREFKEEIGLKNCQIDGSVLGSAFHTASWGGAYFALDVDNCLKNVNWESHIAEINKSIKKFEDKSSLAKIANQGYVKGSWYPEMQKLSWIPARQLVNTMKSYDEGFIHQDVQKFASFLLNHIQSKADLNAFANAVKNHMLKEPIDGNVEAAERFLLTYTS